MWKVETKEERNARLREYRKTDKYKEAQARYKQRALFKQRARTMGDRKCPFCEILLASKFVKRKQFKYCDTCRNDPSIKRELRALYMKRWYAKKVGNEPPSLTVVE